MEVCFFWLVGWLVKTQPGKHAARKPSISQEKGTARKPPRLRLDTAAQLSRLCSPGISLVEAALMPPPGTVNVGGALGTFLSDRGLQEQGIPYSELGTQVPVTSSLAPGTMVSGQMSQPEVWRPAI